MNDLTKKGMDMRKMIWAVLVLALAAPLASFAAAPNPTATLPAALSCAGSGQGLALAGTAIPEVLLFGAQAVSQLQTPLLAAPAGAPPPPKPLCSLSCTPCQADGNCCALCGTCGYVNPRCL